MAAWPTAAGGTGPSPVSKVYREMGGGPVPGHSLQAVAPPAVARRGHMEERRRRREERRQ